MLKETEPLVVTKSFATASDQHLFATLDFVIVRNGPASKLLIRDTETGVRRTCCQLGTSHGPRMYLGKARFVNICIGYDQCDIS